MTERTQEEIVSDIQEVLTKFIAPVVAQHGGMVNFASFNDGVVILEMSGACSGCAGSTMTLKHGAENILKELVPEVISVEGFDDPNSTVDPFYSDPFMYDQWDIIEIEDITNDPNN